MANFGYETYGTGGWWSLVPNKILGIKVTLPVSGTVTSITQYNGTDSGSPHIQYAIYSLSGDLQGQTASYTLTTSYGWHTINLITPVALAAGTYVLAYNVDAAGGYTRQDAATDAMGDVAQTFGTWPPSISVSYSADFILSFYATYGASSTALTVANAAIACASTRPVPSTSAATLTISNAQLGTSASSPELIAGPWAVDFAGISQLTLYKFEVWFGGAWFDVTSTSGYYLRSVPNIKLADGITAGTWSATFHNPGGIFHPNHPSSAYATLFQIGRKVRISVGRMHNGVPYYWQRMIGYMDAPRFVYGSRSVSVSGCDYTKHLTDTILHHPGNYFGERADFDSVSSSGVTGAELYDQADAFAVTGDEANSIAAGWTAGDYNVVTSSATDAGGGSTYVGKILRGAATGTAWTHNADVATIGMTSYYVTFKAKYAVGTEYCTAQFYQTVGGSQDIVSDRAVISGADYQTVTLLVTARKAGALELRFAFSSKFSAENDELRVDAISIKEYNPTWYKYQLPLTNNNGPYFVTLDGVPLFSGGDEDAGKIDKPLNWHYDETDQKLYFYLLSIVPDGRPLCIYYYTDQTPEGVIASLLATSGLYATAALALAAMDYTPTGLTLRRVWFEAGTSALDAVRQVCERVNYRFWFKADGTPAFKPAPVVGEIQFDFEKFGDLRDLSDFQDLNEIKNRVTIEGAERDIFNVTPQRVSSRFKGEASDATSIAAYLEKTESITNPLFESDDECLDMAVERLAESKDPKLYAELSLFANVVPLEVGDTVRWRVEL